MRHCRLAPTCGPLLPMTCSWLTVLSGGGDFGGIDFSKLGGGAGMPTGDDDDEEDSDDDMPPLEGEEQGEKAEKAEDATDAKEVVSSS